MANWASRLSSRTLVASLIAAMIAVVWVEVVKDALEHAEDYTDARAVIEVNQTVDLLLKSAQNLAFERGRTNVVLRSQAPIGDDNRAFLAGRRRAADDNLSAALGRLTDSDLPEVAAVHDSYREVETLRAQVDIAVGLSRDGRPQDLPDTWFAATSGLLARIEELVAAASLQQDHFAPAFRVFTRIKLQALALRNALGVESSRLATAIGSTGMMDPAATAEVLRLRGQAAAFWKELRSEVPRARNDRLREALAAVERKFFREFRPLQDRVFAARTAGHPAPVSTAEYTGLSVPALDSIAALMEVAAAETDRFARENVARARTSMLLYFTLAALALVLGVLTLITVTTQLLRPLKVIQAELRALAGGEVTVPLPSIVGGDEMAEMQGAVIAFRDSLVERQHIADELAHQGEGLTTLINAMPDFVCFKDSDGRWLIVNDYGRALFGLADVDYRGKTDSELSEITAHCRQSLCGCAETDMRAWERQVAMRGEEVVTGADGRVYIFDVVKVPLYRGDGSRRGLVVVGRDITERRRIEAALARLSRQNELILECAGEGIVGMDAGGNTIFANPAAARMTGWDMADLMGRSHHALVHHTRADGTPHATADCPVAKTLADGLPRHSADDMFWRRDGTSFPVEFTADAIVEQGEVRGAVIVFRDIGERKRVAAEIEALLADLKRSNADLEQFAYAVSHDLQEPLRMVTSYLQMLTRRYQGRLDGDADEFIAFAVDGAKRMSAMINALLDYARVGTRGQPLEPLDLEIALGHALANLSTAVRESGAAVEVPAAPARVMGDEAQLVSLFQNLVGNAIKYRAPERPPVIRVAARRDGDTWVISVADNGIGIPPEERERVFGVFQRLNARPDATGTGMGLAICKRIVERLGGRIWIEDADGCGCGCRFVFTLPAA